MLDDGSKLYLSDYLMVNNDSIRTTMGRKYSTQTWIKAGKYPIVVSYFFNGGLLNYLLAEWDGPGLSFARIPQEYLYYSSGTDALQPALIQKNVQSQIRQTRQGYLITIAEPGVHSMEMFNGAGRIERKIKGAKSSTYFIASKELTSGVHIVRIQSDQGTISRTIVVN